MIIDLEYRVLDYEKRCQELENEISLKKKWQDEKEKKYQILVRNMLSSHNSIILNNNYFVYLDGLIRKEKNSEKTKNDMEEYRNQIIKVHAKHSCKMIQYRRIFKTCRIEQIITWPE